MHRMRTVAAISVSTRWILLCLRRLWSLHHIYRFLMLKLTAIVVVAIVVVAIYLANRQHDARVRWG